MIILLMGVAGSGKTTIGRMLADELGCAFFDADEFHSAEHVEKMRNGLPLTDDDRGPWLKRLRNLIQTQLQKVENTVVACSALKESYRKSLLVDENVKLVYLKGASDLIEDRLRKRRGHYLNPKLLDSQFQTLEEPDDCLQIDISRPPSEIVARIRAYLDI